jgi:lia operon protein LiaG
MNKKLIKILIGIWSVIAIGLISFLIYGIVNGKGMGNIFKSFRYSADSAITVQKEENIDINNLNKLNIEFSSSEVVIETTDDPNIKVVQKSSGNLDDDEKFVVDKKGNEVTIRRDDSNQHVFVFNFGNINQRIEVYIPRNYNKDLFVQTSSGNLKFNLDTRLNNVRCKASSGNVSIGTNINCNDVNIEVSSGNINVESLISKTYNVRSTSGNIGINSIAGSGEIQSSSGNVKVNYKDIDEHSNVSAHSGNIHLVVPNELNFEFNGKCSSGDINSSFDLNYKNKKGNEATAQIGSAPYKKLNVSTSSGNIKISK